MSTLVTRAVKNLSSIHDISRTEITPSSPLPRFNMPFECGLAIGAMRYQRPLRGGSRDFLLMAADDFQDKRTLSDLARKSRASTTCPNGWALSHAGKP